MKKLIILSLGSMMIMLAGCGSINRDPYANTPTSGRIKIGVDETFKPVAEAELAVFEALYPYAEITPVYASEKECFQLLMDDSVHLVISSRPLNEDEKSRLNGRKLFPQELKIATDAVAAIVHPSNKDTLLSLQSIRDIVSGKISTWNQPGEGNGHDSINIVFDHTNSGIVNYMVDSVCYGQVGAGHLYALDSNLDVIGYVARNANALGFIGVSWISDSDDTAQLAFLEKVRVVAVSSTDPANPGNSFQPYQAYIFDETYPLRRNIYAIDTEPRNGLATGFLSFLASDKGQRIILKTGILPAVSPVRLVNVRDEM